MALKEGVCDSDDDRVGVNELVCVGLVDDVALVVCELLRDAVAVRVSVTDAPADDVIAGVACAVPVALSDAVKEEVVVGDAVKEGVVVIDAEGDFERLVELVPLCVGFLVLVSDLDGDAVAFLQVSAMHCTLQRRRSKGAGWRKNACTHAKSRTRYRSKSSRSMFVFYAGNVAMNQNSARGRHQHAVADGRVVTANRVSATIFVATRTL